MHAQLPRLCLRLLEREATLDLSFDDVAMARKAGPVGIFAPAHEYQRAVFLGQVDEPVELVLSGTAKPASRKVGGKQVRDALVLGSASMWLRAVRISQGCVRANAVGSVFGADVHVVRRPATDRSFGDGRQQLQVLDGDIRQLIGVGGGHVIGRWWDAAVGKHLAGNCRGTLFQFAQPNLPPKAP